MQQIKITGQELKTINYEDKQNLKVDKKKQLLEEEL